jgi:4-amino-4-deoxy-L-arabinose transferase-like glycosyltransferase
VAAWVCASVAILNAVCWSFITPPFAVSDEPSHVAYVKQLAESHALPSSHTFVFTPEENRVLAALHENPDAVLPATGSISSLAEQRTLEHELAAAAALPRNGSPSAGVATSEPPLYYLLEAIPYTVGSHANLLTRLQLMRLFSALFAGLTAMFAFLFVREALPGTRAVWPASGLAVAFAPVLGFVSGAVNPDSLLFAMSAMVFWALARAFRRGLTARRAAMIGAIAAAGLLTKVNFGGLVPGIILGLGVLALRLAHSSRSSAYRAFGIGAGIAVSPLVLYGLSNLAAGKPAFGVLSNGASLATEHGSISSAISYIWQFFLPRLPGMKAYEPGIFTTRQFWFNGLVGQFGWRETTFPAWAYQVAAVGGLAVLAAFVRTLVVLRKSVRERLAELIVYAVISVGLLILIGGASYLTTAAEAYNEARYLLPLLALGAASLALAMRAAGRRWEAVLGSVIVLSVFADDIFSQLLVISRYYG